MTSASTASAATGHKAYTQLCQLLREIGTLRSVQALLGWDTEVLMPDGGAKARGEQQGMLAGLAHERKTSDHFADALAACEEDEDLMNDPLEGRNLREIRRDFDRATRLPTKLVREISRVTSEGVMSWREARAASV